VTAARPAGSSRAPDKHGPVFSPDGTMIAYTGTVNGNADVYVVPAAGGEPRRLTTTRAGCRARLDPGRKERPFPHDGRASRGATSGSSRCPSPGPADPPAPADGRAGELRAGR